MSSATIKMIDECANLRRNPCPRQNMVRDLTKAIQRYFLEDS